MQFSEKIAYQEFLVRSTARDFWKKSPTEKVAYLSTFQNVTFIAVLRYRKQSEIAFGMLSE